MVKETPRPKPAATAPASLADDLPNLLRQATVFAGLPAATLSRIAAAGELIELAVDTPVIEQGTLPAYLYVLLRGQISLTAVAGGGTAIVEVLRPVDQFQLAAVLTDTPALVTATVLADARLLRIPAAFMRKLSTTDASLTAAMLSSLSQHYRMLLNQVKDLKLRSAAQRLGCFILKLGEEQDFPHRIRLPFGKQILASRLGTTPENLSRAFATLRQHGVATSGSHVVVTDPLRLAAFAVPDEIV
jgi:CRP/FNR family transcriptional regulator, transcriptional activator FtrB